MSRRLGTSGAGRRLVLAVVFALTGGAVDAQVLADTTTRAPSPDVEARRAPPPRPADDWFGRDKALHAGGSFLLTLSGQYVLVSKGGLSEGRALPLSAGATLGLGLLKETADASRAVAPLFSWRDLAADALGVLLAVVVVEL